MNPTTNDAGTAPVPGDNLHTTHPHPDAPHGSQRPARRGRVAASAPRAGTDSSAPRKTPLVNALAETRHTIPYRPDLNKITKSVLASILLQQMTWLWAKAGRRPFTKFVAPAPSNKSYEQGTSWHEELGFSRSEFERAIRAIGTKITSGKSKREARKNNLVIYWTDAERLTYWELNEALLEAHLGRIYADPEVADTEHAGGEHSLGNAGSCASDKTVPSEAKTASAQVMQDPAVPMKCRNSTVLKNAPTQTTDSANGRGSANGRQKLETPDPDALALVDSDLDSTSSSSSLAASETLAKERDPGAKRRRKVNNPKSSEKPEVQEPAPKDAINRLRPDLVSALVDLARKEDQLDGEGLGRPRTAEDVAVRIGYLFSEPGVGDRKVLRSIRKILGMYGVKKSAIGLAIADATRSVEAREAAEVVGAVRQRVARGGSYAELTAFVEDGASKNLSPETPPDKDSYTHNGVLIEDGIRVQGNLRQLDVRISDDGLWYTLEPGQRSDDEFGHDRQAVKERIKIHYGLDGLAKERKRRAGAARRTAEIEALNMARQGREASA